MCLDEKPVSLHADVRPGHVAKRDNAYRRCGTAHFFAVVEPKAGRHFTCATADRSAAVRAWTTRANRAKTRIQGASLAPMRAAIGYQEKSL